MGPDGVGEVLELGARVIVWNAWRVWSDSWMFMEGLQFLVMIIILLQ